MHEGVWVYVLYMCVCYSCGHGCMYVYMHVIKKIINRIDLVLSIWTDVGVCTSLREQIILSLLTRKYIIIITILQ